MIDIAGCGDDELRGMIRLAVELAQGTDAEVSYRLTRPKDRMAVRMRAPERLVMQLEHEVVRRILHHPDLLENNLPLQREIARAQQRPKDDIGDDVGRLHQVLVEDTGLIHRVLTRRVRVQRSTERLELQGNLLRAPPFGPLEHHVLEEM